MKDRSGSAGPSRDRVAGLLFGIAIGDAYGLPYEGMRRSMATRFLGDAARYRLLGRTGFVSDDTELAVLTLEALLRGQGDPDRTERHFRRSLAGWFLRLPFGIGLSTLKASLLVTVGVRGSGQRSAGNGAAMRAGPVALLHPRDTGSRHELCDRLSRVTHTDPRAVEGARFVADLAALCLDAGPDARTAELVERASAAVTEPELRDGLARGLAAAGDEEARRTLPSTGYVVHTLSTAVAYFCLEGAAPFEKLRACVRHGGDTDTIGSILGGWLGALHGLAAWPPELVERLEPGPFGRRHLARLADAVVDGGPVPRRLWPLSLVRNLALYPVVIGHGLLRLLAFPVVAFAPPARAGRGQEVH